MSAPYSPTMSYMVSMMLSPLVQFVYISLKGHNRIKGHDRVMMDSRLAPPHCTWTLTSSPRSPPPPHSPPLLHSAPWVSDISLCAFHETFSPEPCPVQCRKMDLLKNGLTCIKEKMTLLKDGLIKDDINKDDGLIKDDIIQPPSLHQNILAKYTLQHVPVLSIINTPPKPVLHNITSPL